jgi:hypothetical protein
MVGKPLAEIWWQAFAHGLENHDARAPSAWQNGRVS